MRAGSTILFVTALCLLGMACGGSSGGDTPGDPNAIPCSETSPCPGSLECDLARGECTDPTGSNANPCARSPVPYCPCVADKDTIDCFTGSDPTVAASCHRGQSSCDDDTGKYGACESRPDAQCTSVGVGAGSFTPDGNNSDQITLGPDGELVLSPDVEKREFGFLWVANTGENTVSKLDIETGKEVARYASVRDSEALGLHPVPAPGAFNGTAQQCGNCPSRTAIDFAGDAFVANRAHSGDGPKQSSVTKFADDIARCVDRNGNGMIDTSTDVNGDGIIDKNNANAMQPEFLGEDDECILWTTPVGPADAPGGIARALAIDAGSPDGPDGNVWVGLYQEQQAILLGGTTGQPVLVGGAPVAIPLDPGIEQMRPYGAATDGNGYVWFTGIYRDGPAEETTYLTQINIATKTVVANYVVPDDKDGLSQSYGIAIDTKNRVWIAGFQANNLKVFDPASQNWFAAERNDGDSTRGIAPDKDGYVWVALTGGKVARYKIDDIIAMGNAAPAVDHDLKATGQVKQGTIGVGIDKNGACWSVSMNAGDPNGIATRIQPDGTQAHFPVGSHPYTYSDFTGFGLATIVRPQGYYNLVVEGCALDPQSTWEQLEWTEDEPPGTSVKLRVRVADTVAGLASATWYGPFDTSPADLAAAGVPAARYMEVEIQMSSEDPAVSPTLNGFKVNFDCGNDID